MRRTRLIRLAGTGLAGLIAALALAAPASAATCAGKIEPAVHAVGRLSTSTS